MEYGGSDLLEQDIDSIELCAALASDTEDAEFWTYKTKTKKCLLKTSNNDRRDNTADHVSGSSECGYVDYRYDYETVGEYPRRVFLNSQHGRRLTWNAAESLRAFVERVLYTMARIALPIGDMILLYVIDPQIFFFRFVSSYLIFFACGTFVFTSKLQ